MKVFFFQNIFKHIFTTLILLQNEMFHEKFQKIWKHSFLKCRSFSWSTIQGQTNLSWSSVLTWRFELHVQQFCALLLERGE